MTCVSKEFPVLETNSGDRQTMILNWDLRMRHGVQRVQFGAERLGKAKRDVTQHFKGLIVPTLLA
jgi:hypothetical protein